MSFPPADMARISQAIAILDYFHPDDVLAILSRTSLNDRLKDDPAAVRAALLDESRALFLRLRVARHVLIAAGLDDGDPMEPVILSWDWNEQPDMEKIAAAVARVSGERRPVVMRMLDLGSDSYYCVIADREVTSEEAEQVMDSRTTPAAELGGLS